MAGDSTAFGLTAIAVAQHILPMRYLFTLLTAILSTWAVPAAAQEDEEACSFANAVPAEIVQINTDFDAWRGRCVRIRAIHDGWRLLDDRMAALEHAFGGHDQLHTLGINTHRDDPRREPHRPRWEEVVGMLGSCADVHAAVIQMMLDSPGTILGVSGYCHYTIGTFLRPIAYRETEHSAVFRLLPADVPEALWQVRRVPAETPEVVPYVAAVKAAIEALQNSDPDAFIRLSWPIYDDLVANPQRARSGDLQQEKDEAFAEASRLLPAQLGDVRFVLGEVSDDPAADGGRFQRGRYHICYCTTPDCETRLPVRTADIDNDPSRPYFCVNAQDYVVSRQTSRISISIPEPDHGFAEPPQ
ncbi:hypothetical protein GRI97_12135 [Altererythrobacter xixiisoli]|uniref:Uncharacterized protein n=1 Tax=Croceibacterium xixiisoli TaxID=1476466 RepID=A0A6I4TY70_9SPHN|nr:hypothetical protein [Croceibacterium xixiisoli]MXO99737.1 hypothetical protein [Croceibacterium xixiisoli]